MNDSTEYQHINSWKHLLQCKWDKDQKNVLFEVLPKVNLFFHCLEIFNSYFLFIFGTQSLRYSTSSKTYLPQTDQISNTFRSYKNR